MTEKAPEREHVLTGRDITTDFVNDLAEKADDCELDYGDPIGETLRLLVIERDTLRTQLAAAREVRPLEWVKSEHCSEGQEYKADTPFGSYYIGFGATKGERYVDFRNQALSDEFGVMWFKYLKKAKAAAQADYQRRYDAMSALSEQEGK